eukprot:TRINITY_DN2435_c0_g2_i1.p1 TRINITY_DN2435_c0_g2~~TRINITY_DN2435_c0_g2_i1.p1  ORF type:complete len:454 (+),score=96.26 TRINITY_DN2435_c0_g2_i1:39-1364(+)
MTQTMDLRERKQTMLEAVSKPFESEEDVWKALGDLGGGAMRYISDLRGLKAAAVAVLKGDTLRVMESIRLAAVTDSPDTLEIMGELEEEGSEAVVSLSRVELRGLLALSVFGGVPHKKSPDTHWGHLNWFSLFFNDELVSVARLSCLLHYFKATSHPSWKEESLRYPPIDFYRVRAEAGDNWNSTEGSLKLPEVVISSEKRIEDFTEAGSHVDFANKNLQIHKIIPSATQEEVLFSIRPELMVCLPLYSTLLADEAAIFTGAARYCEYTGYLSTFRMASGLTPEPSPPAVIGIDAVVAPAMQYNTPLVNRDIKKCYVGFRHGVLKGPNPTISTGNWGCGAFGGDVILKFSQQLIAAAHAGCPKLFYSTFKNPDLQSRLEALLTIIIDKKITPSQLYKYIQGYKGQCNVNLGMEELAYTLPKSGFEKYLVTRLLGHDPNKKA